MMIKDPVTITIDNSYDWSTWEKALIEKCIYDNPSSILRDLAQRMNMSERTLYRKVIVHKIDVDSRKLTGLELYNKMGKHNKKKV